MASISTRFSIQKLDVFGLQAWRLSNLITRVHDIHVQKCVWFEVELQGAQVNHEAEVIHYSNDNAALNQDD